MVSRKLKKAAVAAAAAALTLCLSVSALAAGLPEKVVPMGTAVGISIRTQGVIVAGLSDGGDGEASPARNAGILPGDVIVRVDGRETTSAAELAQALAASKGDVAVTAVRGKAEKQFTVSPRRDGGGAAIGIWARDSVAGIGTVTFFDPETGVYGALGHPVSDADTGILVPLREGVIMPAVISGVTVGQAGTPGRLGGVFSLDDTAGSITDNSEVGIFGTAEKGGFGSVGESVPVAKKTEIKVGPATILSTTSDGEAREYGVEITRVYLGNTDGRTMMLKVTDGALLSAAGGIVQGMSGSPILQNGKLIGAVTHVLISDPTKGYGIAVEDMLKEAYKEEAENAA